MSPKHVEQMYDALIVGAGAAGLSAALGLLRLRGSRAGVVHYQLLTRIDSPLAPLAKPIKEEA